MNHAIVCEDPSYKFSPGTIIEGLNTAARERRRGVALLPFDDELPRLANMGWAQVFFGAGWQFALNAGERGCPAILNVAQNCSNIYWAARVEPLNPNTTMHGSLRMVHSSDASRSMGVGMRQLKYIQQMPPADSRGGATVFGKGSFAAGMQGLLFTELYAVGRFKVKWFAVSQHREDLDW